MNTLFQEYEYLNYRFPLPQYLGSKYRFRFWIQEYIPENIYSVVDAFGGSQSIAYFLKQLKKSVYTNDLMSFSAAIGTGLIENHSQYLTKEDIHLLLSEMSCFTIG